MRSLLPNHLRPAYSGGTLCLAPVEQFLPKSDSAVGLKTTWLRVYTPALLPKNPGNLSKVLPSRSLGSLICKMEGVSFNPVHSH